MRAQWLGWVLLGAMGCDDGGSGTSQPADDLTPDEARLCGSLLARPGSRTVAQYDDGYLVDANAHVALFETLDGDMRWQRLDTLARGQLTISDAFQEPVTRLLDADHAMIAGRDSQWEALIEVRRLSDDSVTGRAAGSTTLSGHWAYVRESGQMLNLIDGTTHPVDCEGCALEEIAHGQAWLRDRAEDQPVAVDLKTGTVRRYADLPDSIRLVGSGIVLRDYPDGEYFVGANGEPIRCEGRVRAAAADGGVVCAQETGVAIFDAEGARVRFIEEARVRTTAVLGETFIYGARDGAQNTHAVVRVPFDADQPIERIEGATLLEVHPSVAVLVTNNTVPPTARLMDGNGLRDFELNAPLVELSSDGTRGVMQGEDTRQLIDLMTGDVLADVPSDGWVKFVGNTLLHDGAPLGAPAATNLSNLLIPDARCPAALMEYCNGRECTLSVLNGETNP